MAGTDDDEHPPAKDAEVVSPRDAIARLAKSLALPEEKVRAALAKLGTNPRDALELVLSGSGEERIAEIAKALKVSRPRLAVALIDSAGPIAEVATGTVGRIAEGARGVADRALSFAMEVVEFALEIFAETIPRILGRITAVLILGGLALAALGVIAIVDPPLFLKIAIYAVGVGLVLVGALWIWLAWKLHEATAIFRTLAKLARAWRERRETRAKAAKD
ncbi:MAG: hypothetical protein ACYDCK_09550 [Thermoplasmatota archaeon]